MKTGPEACPIILFLQCTRFGNSIIPKRPPNFHFFLRPDAKYLNFTRIFFSKIEIGSDLADIGLKLTTKAAGSRIGVVERKAHKLKAKKNSGRWLLLPAALTLLLAGAVGNLIDRALFGFVTDMFDLQFMTFAVFNVADICVVCGGIAFVVYILFFAEKLEKKESGHDTHPADG